MAEQSSSSKMSVVIPAYNTGAFLWEALDSVLAQTYPAHEILVVDDGSTDDTAAICRSYGSTIRYIYQRNQGISAARNTGAQAATGDWIALLDSDDIALPNRLERAMQAIQANPNAQVFYSAFDFYYPDGSRRLHPVFPAKDLWPAMRYRSPILPSTSTILRSALLSMGGFRQVLIEDWDLWFRMILQYGAAAFQEIPESLVLYRQREGSFTRKHVEVTNGMLAMVDSLLLSGLSNPARFLWRQRIQARMHHELSIELRQCDDPRHLHHALVSLRKWPLCGAIVPARRYKIFAHMVYKQIRGRL